MKEASFKEEEEPPGTGHATTYGFESKVSVAVGQKTPTKTLIAGFTGYPAKDSVKKMIRPGTASTAVSAVSAGTSDTTEITGTTDSLNSGKWLDWQWQYSNRLRTIDALSGLLKLSSVDREIFSGLIGRFHYSVTPYYLSLIDWSNPEDPIRKQCLPDLRELECHSTGESDPLEEEEDMQVEGLVHRYPDRVLAIATTACAMYCRHCTRRRMWSRGERARSKRELAAMVAYVRATPAVREVIVSGGDPLTMGMELLDWFLGELRLIPHVEVLRIGTRVPVVMPMRITDEMARMLKKHRPLWINTQFNHPAEITPLAREAIDRLLTAGIPVSNQSVLLKGINDSPSVMKELCHGLQRIMVRPYYLYQCDPVIGVDHFRTSIWTGIEIIEMMRGHTGGLAVPTYVVDAPGGGGKIPLQPFYLLSASVDEVLLRNYEGIIIKYRNPAESARSTDGDRCQVNADKYVNRPSVVSGVARYTRRQEKGLMAEKER